MLKISGRLPQTEAPMSELQLTRSDLTRQVIVRFGLAVPLLGLLLFLPAGTLAYWEAWLYLAILFIPMTFVLFYLLRNDPELLERRMRTREQETAQSRIVKLFALYCLAIFILPGLDHRFGWSHVPVPLVLFADLLVLAGYIIFFLVLRENRYASRVVEVAKGQQVISSGPYAVVRHPMYLGLLLLYVFSPLALGSYWAVLPALLVIPLLVARIRNEESVLERTLNGYAAYMQHTRFRLIPAIW
jgi:protein-S-isoprenylcysteine O-methyltransferase Ste14